MSKTKVIDTTALKSKSGKLSLVQIITPSGRYQKGDYIHPLGIVSVIIGRYVTTLTCFQNGQLVTIQRTDHPTPRQITNSCRSMLSALV